MDYAKRARELEDFYNSMSEYDKNTRYAKLLYTRGNQTDEEFVKSYEENWKLINLMCACSKGVQIPEDVKSYVDSIIERELISLMETDKLSEFCKKKFFKVKDIENTRYLVEEDINGYYLYELTPEVLDAIKNDKEPEFKDTKFVLKTPLTFKDFED